MEFFKEILKEFEVIESKMSPEVKEEFLRQNYDDLAQFHFSIGLYIRNNILLKKEKIYQVLEKAGFSYDVMSAFLVELLYLYLKDQK